MKDKFTESSRKVARFPIRQNKFSENKTHFLLIS